MLGLYALNYQQLPSTFGAMVALFGIELCQRAPVRTPAALFSCWSSPTIKPALGLHHTWYGSACRLSQIAGCIRLSVPPDVLEMLPTFGSQPFDTWEPRLRPSRLLPSCLLAANGHSDSLSGLPEATVGYCRRHQPRQGRTSCPDVSCIAWHAGWGGQVALVCIAGPGLQIQLWQHLVSLPAWVTPTKAPAASHELPHRGLLRAIPAHGGLLPRSCPVVCHHHMLFPA